MSISICDNYCHVWELDNEIIVEDEELESCGVFSIDVQARFTYPNRDLLDDDELEDEGFLANIDCYESETIERCHKISFDRMNRDPKSAIYDMLDSMHVPVEDFMIDQISACAGLMAVRDCYKNRKVLRMSVHIDVMVEALPFAINSDDDDDEKALATDEGLERVMITEKEAASCCCAICLEDLSVGLEGKRTPCSHLFHGYCILKWLRESKFCPICRFQMPN